MNKKTKGFTLMELLISMTLLALALVIAVNIADPLRAKLEKDIRALSDDTQYLFALSVLDALVRTSDEVEIFDEGNRMRFDGASSCGFDSSANMYVKILSCTFWHEASSVTYEIAEVQGMGVQFARPSQMLSGYVLETDVVNMYFGFLPKLTYNLLQ